MNTKPLETSITTDVKKVLWEVEPETIHLLLNTSHVATTIKESIEKDLKNGETMLAWHKTLLLHEIEEVKDSSINKQGNVTTMTSHSETSIQATSKGVIHHRLLAIGKSTADVSSQTAVDYMKDLLVPVIRYCLIGVNIFMIHIPFVGSLLAFIPMEQIFVPMIGTSVTIGLYMGIAHVVKLHDEKENKQ